MQCRNPVALALAGAIVTVVASVSAWAQASDASPAARAAHGTLSANERMLLPSPQSRRLAQMAGSWDVTMIFRPTPDAKPLVVEGLRAERTMIGTQYLQEVMKPGANGPDFTRISFLLYNAADRRWEYSSIDTRIAGIMNRVNFGTDPGFEISFHMMSFTMPGFGPQFEGRSVRLREIMKLQSEDRDELVQYWAPAGAEEWLAVHYVYSRRR